MIKKKDKWLERRRIIKAAEAQYPLKKKAKGEAKWIEIIPLLLVTKSPKWNYASSFWLIAIAMSNFYYKLCRVCFCSYGKLSCVKCHAVLIVVRSTRRMRNNSQDKEWGYSKEGICIRVTRCTKSADKLTPRRMTILKCKLLRGRSTHRQNLDKLGIRTLAQFSSNIRTA